MQDYAIITITSNDKPGVVEAIAKSVSAHGGNWLESRLANLAGKFVGVVRINMAEKELPALQRSLQALTAHGIRAEAEREMPAIPAPAAESADFHAIGPDRPGIIRELASAFAAHTISLDELQSHVSSMPYSGEPLFEASGKALLPAGAALQDLHERLDEIANELGIDITISVTSETEATHTSP